MTLQERIAEAEQALHQLQIGKAVAKISRGGKTVEFTQANVSQLQTYLNQMKAEQAGSRRRPMRVCL